MSKVGFLTELFHHRWAVRVLAELGNPRSTGRFAPIARAVGVSRNSLQRTLKALVDAGLVRSNPGYGHPLRPEYLLTERGGAVAEWAAQIVRAVDRRELAEVAGRKWSMPVILALHDGATRFSDLEAALPGVTARALALSLKELGDADLVQRDVTGDRPPRVTYSLAPRVRRLGELLAEVP